jgi:16S rRNA processing protein RimM
LTEPLVAAAERLQAGRVGRPHGLDGSFHVVDPAPGLLAVGSRVFVGEAETEVVARKGTDAAPILRLSLATDRESLAAWRGRLIEVPRAQAPALGDDEFWAADLTGCAVVTADDRTLGTVDRMVAYPSCEVLVVGDGLLVPLVRDAIRSVDVAARRIEVDAEFLGI